MENAPVTAIVVGSCGLDARTPKGAFEVCDAGWLGAVGGRVQRRVALDVKIETGAEGCVIAKLGAAEGIIAGEGVEAQVGICGDTGVEVDKGLGVGVGGLG